MGLFYLVAVVFGLILIMAGIIIGYVLRGKAESARLEWLGEMKGDCTESCRADHYPDYPAGYIMLRGGLTGNRILSFDEVMDFINACGVEDECTVAAILAGNPIHVDGADVVFRVAQ